MGGNELTKDDVNLYDRQIRIWGTEAQIKYHSVFTHNFSRIKCAKVAILEIDKCLTVEIVKNLRLSGMENLQILPENVHHSIDSFITVISGKADTTLDLTPGPLIYAVTSQSVGVVSSIPEFSVLQERVRLVNEELNNRANDDGHFQPTISIVGAVCAQEVVKFITGHKPLINNTFLIDTMELRSSVKCL